MTKPEKLLREANLYLDTFKNRFGKITIEFDDSDEVDAILDGLFKMI